VQSARVVYGILMDLCLKLGTHFTPPPSWVFTGPNIQVETRTRARAMANELNIGLRCYFRLFFFKIREVVNFFRKYNGSNSYYYLIIRDVWFLSTLCHTSS
jgi:hypothetical protein